MADFKIPKIGTYGPKMRALQRHISYEHVSLDWKSCLVYKYLGSRTNLNPAITDIQDVVFLETRDRAYASAPISINVWYDPLPEQAMDFAALGIINPLGNEQHFKFHINSFQDDALGRYLIEGDILEIPFLLQDGFPTRYEVSDVDRKLEFENFYVYVTATVMDDKQETAEISNKRSQESALDAIDAAIVALTDAEVPVGGLTGVQTSISQLILTHGGSGYVTAPHVVFTGGAGTGATATAYISAGVVIRIDLNSGGTGYTTLPTISFTGGSGTGATAVAVISGAAAVSDSSTANYRPSTTDVNQDSFLDDPNALLP